METESRLFKTSPASTLHILVVDDNVIHRRMSQTLLAAAGYGVSLAEGGPQALSLIEKRIPDVVLLDVHMPGMDGFEVCRRLRAMPSARRLPVLFLTDVSDLDSADQALNSGADDFLNKPINQIELQMRVRSLMRLRHSEARNRLLFDRAAEAPLTTDRSGILNQWSRQAAGLLGWNEEEVVGQPLSRVIPTLADQPVFDEAIRPDSIPGGETRSTRRESYTALHKSGQQVPVELSLTAIITWSDTTIYGFLRVPGDRG